MEGLLQQYDFLRKGRLNSKWKYFQEEGTLSKLLPRKKVCAKNEFALLGSEFVLLGSEFALLGSEFALLGSKFFHVIVDHLSGILVYRIAYRKSSPLKNWKKPSKCIILKG